jgi:arylsulfatase A-like enzyme
VLNLRTVKSILFLAAALATAASSWAQLAVPVGLPQRPIPEIERVVIISIDGLRPDRLLLANAPTLRGMVEQGAYTFWAKTTAVSVTLPSHVSMLTGVTPKKHRIEWNFELPLKEPVYPRFPTVFELAKQMGYTTAMVTGKSKFDSLTKPGTLDLVFMPAKDLEDDEPVCERAVEAIASRQPHLLFVHFPAVDKRGHAHGWGSREQTAAIERADVCVGRILGALAAAKIEQSTLVIVSSDHGGAGKTHGAEDPRSRHIPWLAVGPKIRKSFDLTQIESREVRTEDTAATAAWALGLRLAPTADGVPVREAFVGVVE